MRASPLTDSAAWRGTSICLKLHPAFWGAVRILQRLTKHTQTIWSFHCKGEGLLSPQLSAAYPFLVNIDWRAQKYLFPLPVKGSQILPIPLLNPWRAHKNLISWGERVENKLTNLRDIFALRQSQWHISSSTETADTGVQMTPSFALGMSKEPCDPCA